MDRSEALGREDIGSLLWRFSIPAIIGMVVNAIYNVVDSIFVGNGVGAIGLTAVTIAFPIMIILLAFGMLVGIGSSTLVSIRLGEGSKGTAERVLGNAFTLVVIIVIVISSLMLLNLDRILIMLGAEPNVLPYARQFTGIILAGSIFMHLGFGLNNVIRAEGNPRTAMATMILAMVLNTILNPLFIFGLKMGIRGSALATVTAQFVAAVWVITYFLGPRSVLKLKPANLRLDGRIVKDIFKLGLSPFLMQLAASAIVLLFNQSLLRYSSDMAVAAYGVINRVTMLMITPVIGISQGLQPIIGYNYGARKYNRVLEALKKAVMAGAAITTAGFVLLEVFAPQIVRMFNSDPNLIAIGSEGLRIMTLMFALVGPQIIGSQYFLGIGKSGKAILLTTSRQIIFLIPLVLILPHFLGLKGIWLSVPISDAAAVCITAVFVYSEINNYRRRGSTPPSGSRTA